MKILDLNPALNMFFHKLGKPTLTYILEGTFSSDQVSALPHVQPNLVYHLPNKNKLLYYAPRLGHVSLLGCSWPYTLSSMWAYIVFLICRGPSTTAIGPIGPFISVHFQIKHGGPMICQRKKGNFYM